MGLQVNNPICIKVDNLQAKSFARGTCVETKLRGTFDIRSDWVLNQELRDAKEVQVDYIHTSNNYADLLTKSHTPVRFDQLVGMIGNKTVKKLVQAKALMVFARMVLDESGMTDQMFPWARTDDLTLGLFYQPNDDFEIRNGPQFRKP